MDTPITRLRNLMSPMINYFAMLKEFDNTSGEKKDKISQLLDREAEVAQKNMQEVLWLVRSLPSDALDETQTYDSFEIGDECMPTALAQQEFELDNDVYFVKEVSDCGDWIRLSGEERFLHRRFFMKI